MIHVAMRNCQLQVQALIRGLKDWSTRYSCTEYCIREGDSWREKDGQYVIM